jgi:hypothetical protein
MENTASYKVVNSVHLSDPIRALALFRDGSDGPLEVVAGSQSDSPSLTRWSLKNDPATSLEALQELTATSQEAPSNFSRGSQQLLKRPPATSLEVPSNFSRGSQQLL